MLIERDTVVWFDLHAYVTRNFYDLKQESWAYLPTKSKQEFDNPDCDYEDFQVAGL